MNKFSYTLFVFLLIGCSCVFAQETIEKVNGLDYNGSNEGDTHADFDGGKVVSDPNGGDVSLVDGDVLFFCSDCRVEKDPTRDEGTLVHDSAERRGESRNVVYEGVLKFNDGIIYSGEYMNGRPHGKGVLRYGNGAVYEGSFIGGKREGNGKVRFTLKDGSLASYEGEWKGDLWSGEGVYNNARLTISGDVFADGEVTGTKATIKEKESASYYVGGIKNGQFHGIGKTYNAAGKVSGSYLFESGEVKAIVLSEKSKIALEKIEDIAKGMDGAKAILSAFTLYTSFSIYDNEPIILIANGNQLLSGASKGNDFFTLIANGMRDLEQIKYQEIEKIVATQSYRASKSNNRTEREFWNRFKIITRTKSSIRSGYVPD